MKATAKDLRFHSKALLDTVSRGEEVLITYRGKPCAKLVPLAHEVNHKKSDLFGMWEDYDEIDNVEGYLRMVRKGRG